MSVNTLFISVDFFFFSSLQNSTVHTCAFSGYMKVELFGKSMYIFNMSKNEQFAFQDSILKFTLPYSTSSASELLFISISLCQIGVFSIFLAIWRFTHFSGNGLSRFSTVFILWVLICKYLYIWVLTFCQYVTNIFCHLVGLFLTVRDIFGCTEF